jgi:AAA family ATP:ADP antiporter
VNRLVTKVVDVRRQEIPTALLMFAYSFLAMTSYNILKPLTRSKFIAQLGADHRPYVHLAAGFLIAFLMQVYTHAIRTLPRRLVIPVTQAGLVLLLIVTWMLFKTGAVWVSVAFYVLGLILGILLISQFWTLANDLYDARQAKRLFGFIGGGASLGGALGAAITALVVEEVGTDNLLLVSAAILALCVVLVAGISRMQRNDGESTDPLDEQRGVGGREAVRLLRSSRHLQIVALVIGCAAVGAGIIEQQLNMAAEATKAEGATDAIAAFLATVTFYLSVIGFVVQVALTSRIHRSLGLAFALLMLPTMLGATGVVILLTGAVWATAVARVADSTLRYTIDKTTREVLFLPLPAELKYRAKPFLDVTVDRFGKAMAAVLLLVLIKPWGLGLDWRRLSYASITVTGIWIAVALIARRQYLQSFRTSIGSRAIRPDAVRMDTADQATIETLVEELSNPDERAVLYAIDMLETLDKRNLVTPLLLHHESPRVRTRALVALEATRTGRADRWIVLVTRMLSDEDAHVRAAAMRALSVLRHEDAATMMRRYLDDVEPRVAVTAAVALADSGHSQDVDLASAALQRLIDDPRDVAAPGRREAAAALAHVRNPQFRYLLVPLLYDRRPDVAQAAIESAGALGPSDGLFVPALASHLGDRTLKGAAREALVGYGEDVLDVLDGLLRDQREHVWIRRHLPATIAATPTQRALDVLMASFGDADGFLRYKVLEAVEQMRRSHPNLSLSRPTLEAQVMKESVRYYNALTLGFNLAAHTDVNRQPLLVRALNDKLARTLDRIYRLLGLLYSYDDVRAARHAIEAGEARRRAAAVEYLDNLLGGAIRKRVMPILEDAPLEQRVRLANVILKTRHRDLEDTVAQLMHEDDPVVAASAIQFVVERGLWSLVEDVQFVAERRADQPYVAEAALWALSVRTADTSDQPASAKATAAEQLPTVQIADRLRALELYASASVDEMFRVADAGAQSRYLGGQEICAAGRVSEELYFLLDGTATLSRDGATTTFTAPSALVFEDVLQRTPLSSTVRAANAVIAFTLDRDRFLAILADNPLVAQGVFRMLLAGEGRGSTVYSDVMSADVGTDRGVAPVDKVTFLRQHPWLEGASFKQLRALAGVADDVQLEAGRALFTYGDTPAIYHVLQGEVLLESNGTPSIRVTAGGTFGLVETLANVPWSRQATVTGSGRALRLAQDDLLAALSDLGFLESLLYGALSVPSDAPAAIA